MLLMVLPPTICFRRG